MANRTSRPVAYAPPAPTATACNDAPPRCDTLAPGPASTTDDQLDGQRAQQAAVVALCLKAGLSVAPNTSPQDADRQLLAFRDAAGQKCQDHHAAHQQACAVYRSVSSTLAANYYALDSLTNQVRGELHALTAAAVK